MVQFSICIPAYKSRYLHCCIQSILCQQVSDFELIILNDCSPEPVEAIVQQFEDKRIQYVKNPHNVGAVNLVENWNACLALAKGQYVLMMGDDDELEPDYLQTFVELIEAYPNLDVYHCRSKIINEEGNVLMLTPACPSFEHVYDSIWHRLAQYRSNYISDFVYRTDNLKQRGGFYALPLAWGSDDITAFIASYPKGIAHTNKPVFRYRSNSLSITSSGNDLSKMEANVLYERWLRAFLRNPPADGNEAIIQTYLNHQLPHLMAHRKGFTMSLSMRYAPLKTTWFWLKHRKRFGLGIKEVLIAAAKSANLKG